MKLLFCLFSILTSNAWAGTVLVDGVVKVQLSPNEMASEFEKIMDDTVLTNKTQLEELLNADIGNLDSKVLCNRYLTTLRQLKRSFREARELLAVMNNSSFSDSYNPYIEQMMDSFRALEASGQCDNDNIHAATWKLDIMAAIATHNIYLQRVGLY